MIMQSFVLIYFGGLTRFNKFIYHFMYYNYRMIKKKQFPPLFLLTKTEITISLRAIRCYNYDISIYFRLYYWKHGNKYSSLSAFSDTV